MKPFESFLAPQLEQYVAYRKSLGYAKQNLKPSLLALDRYVKEKGVQEQLLPPSFFLQFRAELKKPFGSSPEESRSYPVGDFLALLASHIPAPYESLTYYYG